MALVIHPYRKIVFWIKAVTFGMFYMPIFYGLIFLDISMTITLLLVLTPIALLMTWIFVRDRVFTFKDHTLTIKSALDFYPFNRMFKKYTFDFDQIDRITLEYTSGRYAGVSITIEEMNDPSSQADLKSMEATIKKLKSKRHYFFLDNMQRQHIFKWEPILQSLGIQVVIKD